MKRVFIYANQTLFGQGIRRMLTEHSGLEVIGWEADLEGAIPRIRELQPDAILLVTDEQAGQLSVDGQHFLKAGINAKIVELSLADSNVCVYCGNQYTVRGIVDLVHAIEQPLIPIPGSLPLPEGPTGELDQPGSK